MKFNPDVSEFKTVWGLWWGMTWRFCGVYMGGLILLGLFIRAMETLY